MIKKTELLSTDLLIIMIALFLMFSLCRLEKEFSSKVGRDDYKDYRKEDYRREDRTSYDRDRRDYEREERREYNDKEDRKDYDRDRSEKRESDYYRKDDVGGKRSNVRDDYKVFFTS